MTGSAAATGRPTRFWLILYAIGSVAVATLKLTDAIDGVTALILFAGVMALLIPMVRAAGRGPCASPATRRYNRRILIASFGYLLGLGAAIALWHSYELSDPLIFLIALLPVLPTFAMIWAMARYVIEEGDEYLRHRTIMAALVATELVLALGIFWGFLEMFGLVPHVWAWWVLPAWALGLGVGQGLQVLRDRREGEE